MSSSNESIEEKKFNDNSLVPEESSVNNEQIDPCADLSLPLSEKEAKVEALAQEMGINHKKLMWKIDICVVPPFCLLYFLAFLDRVNISNAKVYGIEKDLGLVGQQFNTALTVFFVPYIVFEVISNYCLKMVKPHIWLFFLILFFGAVTIGMGFVTNFGGLVACRFLLGIFESGLFPSIFYILANFYSQRESQKRFSTFFSCTCLSGGCAGALAYRIADLDGVHGLSAWQWIFVIEGAFTCGLAFFLYFAIADFPEQARFLSDNEKIFIKRKLEIYSGSSGFETHNTIRDVCKCFKEPMLLLGALSYFGYIIPAYSYAYFAPTIIKGLGYTAMEAQRHSIYPWLCAFGFTIGLAFISDKTGKRLPFALLASAIAVAGLAMILAEGSSYHVKYGGCFLAAMGLYTAMPQIVCWFALNFAGHLRKGVGTAFIVGFGNIGGIIASFIFPNNEAPRYVKGLSIGIAFVCFSIVMNILYFGLVYYRNKQKQSEGYREKWNQLTDRQRVLAGDLHPDFRYLY